MFKIEKNLLLINAKVPTQIELITKNNVNNDFDQDNKEINYYKFIKMIMIFKLDFETNIFRVIFRKKIMVREIFLFR